MNELKIVAMGFGLAVSAILFIGGIIFVCNYFGDKKDDARLARSIQCKETGGTMSYDNYSWICK